MDAKEQVLQALKDAETPLKGGEIAERTGLDKKLIDKAIKELKTEDKIDTPKRCFYAPK